MEKILDANLIIRYLVKDNEKKIDNIEKLLKSDTVLILTDVTIAEIVWVLSSYYELPRKKITRSLTSLILLSNIKCNKNLLLKAFSYFEKYNIDWVDSYLCAYAEENRIKEIFSYDRDLDRTKTVKRIEP